MTLKIYGGLEISLDIQIAEMILCNYKNIYGNLSLTKH